MNSIADNKPLVEDIVGKLSEEVLSYYFPGADIPILCHQVIEVADGVGEMKDAEMAKVPGSVFGSLYDSLDEIHDGDESLQDGGHALDERTRQILSEIKAIQEKYGLDTDEFDKLLDYTVKPSRLRISKVGDICLVDFQDREVKMDVLSKAVFFLFLKHPEGIRYKELSDHRKELLEIYMGMTGKDDLESIEKSIDDLIDPLNNSINVKVSRINAAFCNAVSERIAQFYFIDGERGEKRSIALDRRLVVWE